MGRAEVGGKGGSRWEGADLGGQGMEMEGSRQGRDERDVFI